MLRQLKQSKFSLLNPKPTQISFVKTQGFTLPNIYHQIMIKSKHTHTEGYRDLGKKAVKIFQIHWKEQATIKTTNLLVPTSNQNKKWEIKREERGHFSLG